MVSPLPLLCWLLAAQTLASAIADVQQARRATVRLPEHLLVSADDTALASQISRAARQHFHGEVEVKDGPAASEPLAPGTLRLFVHRSRSGGLQIALSLGPGLQVRRTLSLAESSSRLDAAEAVAIGLPDMLARLRKSAQAPSRDPEARAAPIAVPDAAPAMAGTRLATQGWPKPPDREPAPAGEPLGAGPKAEQSEPTPATREPAPPVRPADQPRAAPLKEPRPAPRGLVQKGPLPVPPSARRERSAPSRVPPGPALGLLSAGTALFITGIGLGAAALGAAQKIDDPTPMPFDKDLDRRGKAENIAAITLDVVGGAALAAGGAWAMAWYLRRGRTRAPLHTLVVPSGAGLLLLGRF